ncbi:hypothetical protein [uncultured Tenacibaculum sp.]|uniref:hypothetical protein n=1 Tax=uncultured Tenacibaculum sp. TaxID=174713 RepID=UPI002609A93E|nr:hypothetical protein [uncultured Tenacibaculum sp.]
MKTYISDIIPKIQRFSQKLDNLTMLTNQHWVVIDDIENSKNVYIFRQNNELLISHNGKVEKAKWEYLGHNSLLIDRKDESYLFKHGFFDENILALKIDSKNEYAFLVNETKFDKELNSLNNIIEFLNKKYIESGIKQSIQEIHGVEIESSPIPNPNYTETFLGSEWSLFGGNQNKFKIEFQDGNIGELYLKNNSGKYRIICQGTHVYYSSKTSAINALYNFILTRKILEKDRTYI